MLKNLFVNSNLEILISYTEKSSVITTSSDFYSEFVSSSLEIQILEIEST